MSYPPPPGINNLPARPPPPASGSNSAAPRSGGFKSAFNAASSSASSYTPPSYGPSAPPSHYAAPSSYAARPSPVGGMSGSSSSYQYNQQPQPQSYGPSAPPPSYNAQATTYGAAPQIRNPFPLPGQPGSNTAAVAGPDFDPEMAAQIAQWQSAYVTKDEASGDQQPSRGADASAAAAAAAANIQPAGTAAPGEKKKTVPREGGGKKWTDDTLLEWDPSHLRLFVGNLAGETTDDSLLKAFSRWRSVQKAKVVRDKRTTKSKGFGFVSFSDADDFFQAAKEMNGKYIQSHPVVVRKANTEIKVTNVKEKDRGRNGKKRNNQGGSGAGRGGGGGGNAGGYDAQLGPAHGAGVTKPGQKTKNGLRLLG